MPGRLIMDQEGAARSIDLKKDRSQAQAPAVQNTSLAQANGVAYHDSSQILPNGAAVTHSQHAGPANHGPNGKLAVEQDPNDPPPLDQSWRDGEQNKSLGKLMERVAQQCYHDLSKTLDDMSAISAEPQQPHMANGVAPHTGPDASESSLAKKRLLMNFANEQRDRFTKTLVISDWSRNIDDKARLIDIKVWLDKQRVSYEQAEYGIMQTKANMRGAKVPNPNIEGAMEVLASGKASWIPDLGYVPAKPLSAKQLLDTIRGMNVTLATRLSLHEDLPPYLQNYTIADGRATFTVRDEFEVDLSIADEDPATPFYFIDIRLAFEPAAAIVDDRIRAHLEGMVNSQLAQDGLKGCYDWLHNFVLTHKLNVLKSQAAEMVKTRWFDCIKIETLRRTLIVQYWAGMEGPKSWIEIGLNSGKDKATSPRWPPNPYISVRRFYEGLEIKESELSYDWSNLSMEECLLQVIQDHTKRMLLDLQTRISALAPTKSPFTATMSTDQHLTPALLLTQPFLTKPIRVSIEPVTGQYSITPPSVASLHTERRLNDAPTDAARWLAGLPCAVVQERARKQTELLGWSVRTDMIRQDNLAALLDEKSTSFHTVYKPNSSWGDKWALAASFSLGKIKWLVVELQDTEGRGKTISHAAPLQLPGAMRAEGLSLSRESLIYIEQWAVADVSVGTLSKQLRSEHIQFKMEKAFKAGGPAQTAARTRIRPSPSLFIHFSKLMRDLQKRNNKEWQPWADEVVKLTHRGMVSSNSGPGGVMDKEGIVQHDVRLSLKHGKMQDLRKQIAKSKGQDLIMNSTGGMALRFSTPFGQPFVEQIRERLRGVEELNHYASVLRERRFICTHLSLSQVAFTYSKSPDLSIELSMPSEEADTNTATISLHPPTTNPHSRIRIFLESAFENTPSRSQAFVTLIQILSFTLPILRSFDELERSISTTSSPVGTTNGRTISIHPRSSTSFRVIYHAPFAAVRYDVRAKVRRVDEESKVRWLLDSFRPVADDVAIPEGLGKAVQELWKDGAFKEDEGIEGIRTGVIAGAMGIATVVGKIDEVVRKFPVTEDEKKTAEEGKADVPATTDANTVQKETEKETKPIKAEPPDVIMLD